MRIFGMVAALWIGAAIAGCSSLSMPTAAKHRWIRALAASGTR